MTPLVPGGASNTPRSEALRRPDLAIAPLPPALWPALGILVLVLVNSLFDTVGPRSPGLWGEGSFLHLSVRPGGAPAGAMIDVLNYGSTIGILAIGMTPVIAMRGIDLSVGSVMALAACVAGMLSTSGHGGFVAVLGGIAVGGLCGLWNALLVAHFRIQPFVATLVLLVAARGIAQMVTSSQIVTFHDNVIEFIGLGRPPWMPLPFPFLLVTGLLALTLIALRCSALGLLIRAVGGNPEAARLAGVRAPSLIACSYVFCGLCAGIAGLIAAANIKAADPFNTGRNFELAAIFAVVVGGTPLAGGRLSLVGAFVGAMLMQCLTTTMYARNVSADVAPLPQALLILGVCIAGSPRVHGALRAWRSRSVP